MDCLTPHEVFTDLSRVLGELHLDRPEDGLIGLRRWRLAVTAGRVELGSTFTESTWIPGTRLAAECDRGHRAGSPQCSCGFHISLPSHSAAQQIEREMLASPGIFIVGAARVWGQVTVESDLMRAEYARPEAIFVHAHHDGTYRALAENLADKYEVELVDVASAAGIFEWTSDRDGVLTSRDLESLLASQPIRLRPIGTTERPLLKLDMWPQGFWPAAVAPPRSSDAVHLPTRTNPLAVYPVVGMVHHPGKNPEHADRFQPSVPVRLVPEPHNPHDRHAIAVFDQSEQVQLGYLPRQIARDLTPQAIGQSHAWLLCTWRHTPEDDRPFSAHVLVIPSSMAERVEFG